MRETEQLLEISLLKKKLMETEQAMSRIIADMGSISKGQVSFYLRLNGIVFYYFVQNQLLNYEKFIFCLAEKILNFVRGKRNITKKRAAC